MPGRTVAELEALLAEREREVVRLDGELRARTAEQTATAEVLCVIKDSATNLPTVFDAIARTCVRVLGAQDALVFRVDGAEMEAVAHHGPLGHRPVGHRFPVRRDLPPARAVIDRATLHLADVLAESDDQFGCGKEAARTAGHRTVLVVPMLRGTEILGVIYLRRGEVRPFTDAEMRLTETFADQAIIAIENARLFGTLQERTAELTHSVERLTALFDVSRAVSGTLDLQRVLDTVVARASDLAGADGGAVYEFDPTAAAFDLRSTYRMPETMVAAIRQTRIQLGQTVVGEAGAKRGPVQYQDVLADATDDATRQVLRNAGYRAVLAVPLLRESDVVGALVVRRKIPGAFDPDTVALLQTFATQSALAIQNARLFQELTAKTQQLEEASRHKSEFLANMSHELRTPLNAIIGFTEVLLEKYFGELNDKQGDYLKDVLTSGQHLLALINDILDLSKVEAGRMELEPTTFALGPVLEAGLVMVKERATRHGIALGLKIEPDTGRIEADERKIKQVVFNLLSNAVKFTPDGGRVDLRAWRRDGRVSVAVRDTGVGIAPDDQARIFEEFQQARGQALGKVEGTGLGLTLCKRFVEMHGGRIWVESAIGEGSTFTFELPVEARCPAS